MLKEKLAFDVMGTSGHVMDTFNIAGKSFCFTHRTRLMYASFAELTPEQQKILIDIRRRKTELLLEIQVSSVCKASSACFLYSSKHSSEVKKLKHAERDLEQVCWVFYVISVTVVHNSCLPHPE